EEWLRKMSEKFLSKEEMDEIEAMGGFEKLMETLQKRLDEQKKRHEGGNKW
ncbi:MAG TPA: VWA domain-containing protein, partial [Hyphomonas sp.]|nr:VWA domain-containing protein [Hyphomonas sp.]